VEEKNTQLKKNVEDLRKEIDYLKTLMLDVVKARMKKNGGGADGGAGVSVDDLLKLVAK